MQHNVLMRFMLSSAKRTFSAPTSLLSKLAKTFMVLCLMLTSPALLAQVDPDCGDAMANYWQLGLSTGVSPLSEQIVATDYAMLIICTVIGIIVFGAMFISIIFHRKGRREPAQFHHSTVVELIWTIVPVMILVGIAVWVVGLLLAQEDNSGAEMEIDVIGYQWLWEYNYPEHGISFYSKLSETSNAKRQLGAISVSDSYARASEPDGDCYLSDVDNRLVIPANTKILMKVSSRDVVHAWSVDAFDFKMDAYPNIVNERWLQANKPGVYRGWCKELCGRDHAFMPIVVEVLDDTGEDSDWKQWLEEQKQQNNPSAGDSASKLDSNPANNLANSQNTTVTTAVAVSIAE